VASGSVALSEVQAWLGGGMTIVAVGELQHGENSCLPVQVLPGLRLWPEHLDSFVTYQPLQAAEICNQA
jgi:hypothetical protein